MGVVQRRLEVAEQSGDVAPDRAVTLGEAHPLVQQVEGEHLRVVVVVDDLRHVERTSRERPEARLPVCPEARLPSEMRRPEAKLSASVKTRLPAERHVEWPSRCPRNREPST